MRALRRRPDVPYIGLPAGRSVLIAMPGRYLEDLP